MRRWREQERGGGGGGRAEGKTADFPTDDGTAWHPVPPDSDRRTAINASCWPSLSDIVTFLGGAGVGLGMWAVRCGVIVCDLICGCPDWGLVERCP
eukprot:742783-Prymnesium_polylepis.2